MLTFVQREAGIAYLKAEAASARAAIEAKTWHFWESDSKAQQLGAVRIVEDTSLRAMAALALRNTEDGDARFLDVAHQAEASLAAIEGYAASATFDSVLASTASATADQVGQATGAVAKLAWQAIPTPVLVVAGLVLAGVAYVYARPFLPRSSA